MHDVIGVLVVDLEGLLLLAGQIFLCRVDEFDAVLAVKTHIGCLQLVLEEGLASPDLLLGQLLDLDLVEKFLTLVGTASAAAAK